MNEQLRASTDQERNVMQRAADMDRQSRVLWLKTFSTSLETMNSPKAADEAARAVERFRMAFDDPKLVTSQPRPTGSLAGLARGDGSFPWCEACESFHHPDNPSCKHRVRLNPLDGGTLKPN